MKRFEVLGVVGEGAYGVVLKCKNKKSKEIIAIKKFKDMIDSSEKLHKIAMREVRMLKEMKHENIVHLKEAFQRRGKLYLVFEYVDRNLLEILEETPSGLKSEAVRKYIYQLVKAIHYMHQKGIIHRDIKPENLLISKKGKLKLCDFGFARKWTNDMHNLTDYVATRWYRAPELLLGQRTYDKSVDLWAIACIMGEITDTEPLFPGDDEIHTLYLIQQLLGKLTKAQKETFFRSQKFPITAYPDYKKTPIGMEKRYLGKMSKRAVQFMKDILKLDPKDRLSTIDALRHPYFKGLNDEFVMKKKQVEKNKLVGSQILFDQENTQNSKNNQNFIIRNTKEKFHQIKEKTSTQKKPLSMQYKHYQKKSKRNIVPNLKYFADHQSKQSKQSKQRSTHNKNAGEHNQVGLGGFIGKTKKRKAKSKSRKGMNPSQSPTHTFYPTLKSSNYGFKKYVYGKSKNYNNKMFPKVKRNSNKQKYKFGQTHNHKFYTKNKQNVNIIFNNNVYNYHINH